jgi:hypothetical protein
MAEIKWEVGQIVLITHKYPNGKKSRLVGVINHISGRGNKKDGSLYVGLTPLPEKLAKPIREEYCTEEYNHQGTTNCYCDQYGFGYHDVHPDTTKILGTYKIPKPTALWSPEPGNAAYDLMC